MEIAAVAVSILYRGKILALYLRVLFFSCTREMDANRWSVVRKQWVKPYGHFKDLLHFSQGGQ